MHILSIWVEIEFTHTFLRCGAAAAGLHQIWTSTQNLQTSYHPVTCQSHFDHLACAVLVIDKASLCHLSWLILLPLLIRLLLRLRLLLSRPSPFPTRYRRTSLPSGRRISLNIPHRSSSVWPTFPLLFISFSHRRCRRCLWMISRPYCRASPT